MTEVQAPSVAIRATRQNDIASIQHMTVGVGVFNRDEVATVDELLDAYFTQGAEASGYHFLTACELEQVLGFACFGPRALTQGVFDLYWIVVSPYAGRRGIGGALLAAVEAAVQERHGRMIIAETSGREAYGFARRFYRKYGYAEAATIADFYAPGDDLVIYTRRVG